MTAPTLSPGEQAAIKTAVEAISAAQAQRERPAQVLADDSAAIIALGVPATLAQAAAAAGFSFRVDEYLAPAGPGWVLSIFLTRGGQRWRFAHHVGPETHRDDANGWALAPLQTGGA